MKGTEILGTILDEQMKNVNDYSTRTPSIQLGMITSNRGLKLDSVSYTIPPSDYMVSRSAFLISDSFKTEEQDEHTHFVKMPSCFRPIKSGDRVLVAMVGTEPIVIDIVVPADAGAFGG